jgi:PAS domain S-box-containing protein
VTPTFRVAGVPLSGFILPWMLAVALVMGLCALLYKREANQIDSNNFDRENRRMEIFSSLFTEAVSGAASDLRVLATGDSFEDYLSSNNPSELERAKKRAQFVSRENPDYDQIRYIDENGQEMIRVNHDGQIVPPNLLQNKASRGFFKAAMKLANGQTYISAIDLNIENGQIETPYKPTLRVAVPVFDPSDRPRGIFVINILAGNGFDHLREFIPRYAHRLRVLNSQGYWLVGATPDQEWGFVLPGRSDYSLAKSDPDLWAKVQAAPQGQEPYHGGYFTWKYAPTEKFAGRVSQAVTAEPYLIFASEFTGAERAATLDQLRQTFIVISALLVFLTTLITGFVLARRQAQNERDRYFNLTRDMLSVIGFDGIFRRLNPAWHDVLGWEAHEMVGRPFIDFVHPEDRKSTLEAATAAAHGDITGFENRYRAKDGSYRWLLWNTRSAAEDQLIFGSAHDLTERKRFEEELRLAEERSRLMVEGAQDYAIFMLGPEGRVMSWNAGAERMKGYAAPEIIGQHFSIFYPPEIAAERAPDTGLIEAARHGRFEDEGWRMRKDGSRFWANDVINAIRDSQGGLMGFVKITRDMTSRRKAEERIMALNEDLKLRADQLESANKELESFSYSVSHDLRAPLRHIHGFVELLQKAPGMQGDESAQRQMGVIARAAREMGMLIDDLLAFSRTGRAEMNPVLIDMNEMAEQALRSLEMECKGRKVSVDIQPMQKVHGDPGLLRLVWVNLLGNALKYTRPREEARIEVGQLPSEPQRPDEVVFYVRDNGVGFDMQYASKLFGVFQRLHRSEDFEGTGIGLANVQRIVHRHGGRVWAESKVDFGATFCFSLPLHFRQPS